MEDSRNELEICRAELSSGTDPELATLLRFVLVELCDGRRRQQSSAAAVTDDRRGQSRRHERSPAGPFGLCRRCKQRISQF